MRVYERARFLANPPAWVCAKVIGSTLLYSILLSTTTRIAKDSTLLSPFNSAFEEASPPPNQLRNSRAPRKLAVQLLSCVASGVGCCIVLLWGLSHKIMRLQFSQKEAQPESTEQPSCCRAFLEGLTIDRNLDPCEDFQHYVSARKSRESKFRWNDWNARKALLYCRYYPEAAILGDWLAFYARTAKPCWSADPRSSRQKWRQRSGTQPRFRMWWTLTSCCV
ncbi:hypothetical protein HPB52_017298 [Rhipicephalus sanguineus]|uniref:Uncharacterized protein n=1 Tax=Rhipicephalus sanguineus TaxID=34632 RepID=A0A9D4PMY3_RHISA|nr:hypothetical protein HPB52_017298 [Rhipicephalus sanguineus]